MTRTARAVLVSLTLVIALLFGGAVLVITTAERASDNSAALAAIEKDRQVRIAARCDADHRAFLAQQTLVDFIDSLIHQGDIEDSRIPEDLRALAKESRALSEQKLAEVRAQIAGNDCHRDGRG